MAHYTGSFVRFENTNLWKERVSETIRKTTQDLLVFSEFVHLHGRFTFDIDGQEKCYVHISEVIMPGMYHELIPPSTHSSTHSSTQSAANNRVDSESAKIIIQTHNSVSTRKSCTQTDSKASIPRNRDALETSNFASTKAPLEVMELKQEVEDGYTQESMEEQNHTSQHDTECGFEADVVTEAEPAVSTSRDLIEETGERRRNVTDGDDLNMQVDDDDEDENDDEAIDENDDEFIDDNYDEANDDKNDPDYNVDPEYEVPNNEVEKAATNIVPNYQDDEMIDPNYGSQRKKPKPKKKTAQRKRLNKEKLYKCVECPCEYATVDQLSKHVRLTHRSLIRCLICPDLIFPKKAELKAHYKAEHGGAELPEVQSCGLCIIQFTSVDELEQHRATEHVFHCELCGAIFNKHNLLYQHEKEMHPEEARTCKICAKDCGSIKAARKHMRCHKEGEDERLTCKECNKKFKHQYSLFLHERAVHRNASYYKCDQCDEAFNYHNTLKLHKLKHKGERPYKCSMVGCKKSYLTSSHLTSHIAAKHSIEKKFQCPVCNKRFPYGPSLKIHMRLHTDTREFKCSQCDKGFITSGALKYHEETHNEAALFKCQYCEKMYRTNHSLRCHERRHTDDNSRYMCDICGQTFMFQSNLDAHAPVHGNERLFQCKVCDKRFKTSFTLYSHANVHQTERPFICDICAKGFKTKGCLTTHMNRHSGAKPFKCQMCKSCFGDKGGLTKHMKTVHASKPNFQCPSCSKVCSRADNLRVHMKVHNDPQLFLLSNEELMIEKPAQEAVTAILSESAPSFQTLNVAELEMPESSSAVAVTTMNAPQYVQVMQQTVHGIVPATVTSTAGAEIVTHDGTALIAHPLYTLHAGEQEQNALHFQTFPSEHAI